MATPSRPSLSIRRLTGRATDRLNERLLSSSEAVAGVGLAVAIATLGFALWFRHELSYQSEIGVPLSHASSQLNASINESVAALRGWVAYGSEESLEVRRQAWRGGIEPAVQQLQTLTAEAGDAEAQGQVARIAGLLRELEVVQWAVEDVARTPGNEPSAVAYEMRIRPIRMTILQSLAGAIERYGLRAGESSIEFLTELARFRSAFTRTDLALSDYLLRRERSRLASMSEHLGRARRSAARLESTIEEHTSGDLLSVLGFALDEFRAYDALVRRAVLKDVIAEGSVAQGLYVDEVLPLIIRTRGIASELAERQSAAMQADSEALTTASGLVIVIALLMGLLSGGSLLVSYRLQRQVRGVVERAKKLGQYDIEKQIGRGGMGDVYLARHAMLRRPTAIKLLRAENAHDLRARNRFQQEVQLTSQLTHPNTIEIFDYGRTPHGIFYYAMEYIDGFSLDALVRLIGPVPPARVVHLLLQACGSLQEAHERGLLHRDIKPSNLMLTRRGGVCDTLKILDFGLVRDLSSENDDRGDEDRIAGTPMYLAPESILSARGASPRSDLYALGCVAYFLLTGTTVFASSDVAEILACQLDEEIPFPSQRLGHALPEDLEYVVMSCLTKDPADRPQSAGHLASLLRACKCGQWSDEDARLWWEEYGEAARRQQPVDPASGSLGSGLEIVFDASRG